MYNTYVYIHIGVFLLALGLQSPGGYIGGRVVVVLSALSLMVSREVVILTASSEACGYGAGITATARSRQV